MAAGCRVHDIGLAVTPMAYFAQFDLDVPCVAMVTASHNDNGWTGVKMGANRPLTFGPDEMTRLKEIVLGAKFDLTGGGSYRFVEDFPARYIADLTNRPKAQAPAQGGGGMRQRHGGGVFAARAGGDRLRGRSARLRARLHLPALQSESRRHGDAARDPGRGAGEQAPMSASASTATATAAAWSTTRAKRFSPTRSASCWRATCRRLHPGAKFVVDVKSTGLFVTDPVLQQNGVKADYWKTGHSYMKRRTHETGALAGFEKSGHFFFNKPYRPRLRRRPRLGARHLRHARPQSR